MNKINILKQIKRLSIISRHIRNNKNNNNINKKTRNNNYNIYYTNHRSFHTSKSFHSKKPSIGNLVEKLKRQRMEKLNQHDESMEKEKRKKRRWKEEDDNNNNNNNNNSNQKKKIQRQHIQREHKVRPAVSEYVTTDFNQRRNLQLKNPKFKGRGNLYCAICDVMCSDEKNYNVHINGRKHKNKAKMLQLQQQGGRTSEMNTDDNDSKYAEFGFKNINDLKDVTEEQIEKLQKQFGDTVSQQKKRKLMRALDPVTPYRHDLVTCLKKQDANGAVAVYKEIREKNINIPAEMSCMFLQLICQFLGQDGVELSNDSEILKVGSEIALKLQEDSNETQLESENNRKKNSTLVSNYSMLIRFFAFAGDIANAIHTLDKFREFAQEKIVHRMYFPIIVNHPIRNINDLTSLMKIFKDGLNEPNMTFEKETDYITMFEKIDGIYQSCNDEKHDLEFQKAIRSVIYEMENNISKVSPKVIECIDNRLSKFLTVNKHHEETSTSSSSIDTSNNNNNTVCIENDGQCPICQSTLKSIDLKPKERQSILDSVAADLANESNLSKKKRKEMKNHKTKNRNKKKHDNNRKPHKTYEGFFDDFKKYMKRNGGGIDIIIDGANVGFTDVRFPQNPMKASKVSIRHYQINSVIDHFKSQGKKILLVLHRRHLNAVKKSIYDLDGTNKNGSNSNNNYFNKQYMHNNNNQINPKAMRYFEKWEKDCLVYHTPTGMNDDWFWLYACLSESKSGRQPLVITNDMMRDHHFKLLSQHAFLNWRERHVVNFYFTPEEGRTQGPVPTFFFPQKYSTRIQIDGKPQSEGLLRYHFPVSIVNEENVQVEDSATISSQFPSVETILQNNKNKYGKIEWACVEENVI